MCNDHIPPIIIKNNKIVNLSIQKVPIYNISFTNSTTEAQNKKHSHKSSSNSCDSPNVTDGDRGKKIKYYSSAN